MKKIYSIGAVAVVIIVAAVVVMAMNKPDEPGMMATGRETMGTPVETDTAEAVATDMVAIDNFTFSPKVITVKKGTKVTWTNNDSVAHDVTADNGSMGLKSERLKKGDSYSYTFDTAGTYTYFCSIHPDMKGTVVVTN